MRNLVIAFSCWYIMQEEVLMYGITDWIMGLIEELKGDKDFMNFMMIDLEKPNE